MPRNVAPAPIPPLYPVLAAPAPAPFASDRRVSIAVTRDVPLTDVLFQLGREAEVDMEIDPRIEGGVTFSAIDRPFLDVIDRISDLAGLRYTATDNRIRIEVDMPYAENYTLPSLALARNTTSNNSIKTGLVNSTGSRDNDTASSVAIASESKSDFYTTLQAALQNILTSTLPAGMDQAQTAPRVVINAQTGVVTVVGTSRQQRAVRSYLDNVRRSMSSQVSIQARVIEVALGDGFQAGINWNTVFGLFGSRTAVGGAAFATGAGVGAGVLNGLSQTSTSMVTFTVRDDANNGASDTILRLIERFGTVRTLSSPRVTVTNNQTALLKVAQNYVYFTLNAQFPTTSSTGPGGTTTTTGSTVFTSQVQTVPIGFVMAVQPSIDLPSRTVTFTLRPTITQLNGFVADPAVNLNAAIAGVTVQQTGVPIVDVRELDSVMQLRSGEVGIMGGLMRSRSEFSDQSVPGLSDIPILGNLFRARGTSSEMTELVILLQADIVDTTPPIGPADRRLYEDFTTDPRPMTF